MEVQQHVERERGSTQDELERLRSENAAMGRRLYDYEQQHADLVHQRAALKTVLASIPYSVFWKDRESIYRGCNQQFAQRAGVASPEQIIGKTDYDLPWAEEAEIYRAGDRRVLSGDKGFENVEEAMITAEGQSTVILVSKGPLRGEVDDIIGVIGTFTDITARKQMEIDLQLAKEKAEAADRAKGDFLATVSHELRTPLALILGPLEQLATRPELSEAAQQDVHRVLRNAWRLKNLVDDILEFTKGEARMRAPRSETLDIEALTNALVDEAQGAAAIKHLTLTFEADPLPPVALDPHMFERVLLNLLGNAIKFTPAHGKIEVALRDRGSTLALTVRDSGIGISVEDQQRLFRRFQQVDASSTRGYEGTGLGLALVKQFAELMGGSVAVHSELGHGAEFIVVLPKTTGGEATLHAALLDDHRVARMVRLATSREHLTPTEVPIDDGRPLVALVEDHADLRAYAAEVLSARYRVMTYPNGAAALLGLRLHRPAVVVSDVMMPLLDGHELVAAMKADPELRDIPIILLTAQAGRDVLVESLERGADDFLNKPFSAPELLARVAVAVRLRTAYRELHERNQELVSTQEMLIETEKLSALGRLLSQLSHEINNPMTVIIGNLPPAVQHFAALKEMIAAYRAAVAGEPAERLHQRSDELELDFALEDFPELLQAIEEAAMRVQLIQRDLRSFLRGEAVARSPGDLNEGLRVTIDMLRRGLPGNVTFRTEYGVLPRVEFHSGQLKQVFLNVLQNAVDAVSPSGTIEISSFADAERITISIADDGPGIPAPERRKIFEPFFTTKEVGKGSGIGLAVCRQILTNHGGSIRLDESAKRGARFVIELPRTHTAGEP